MTYSFDPFLLIQATQNRGKFYSWSQMFLYTGMIPRKLITLETKPTPNDPFWLLTQSYKNYSNVDLSLKYYFLPEMFEIYHNSYGMTSRFIELQTGPTYLRMVKQTEWYERQRFIRSIINFLYLVPGVHKIYLVGSAQLEISTENSDIDLAVQCYKLWVLPARIVLKLVLKISKTDVHPLGLELLLGLYKITNQQLKADKILAKIYQFRKQKRIKIDAGLFFENKDQLWKYFERTERNIWIYDLAYIPSNYSHDTNFKDEVSICYLPYFHSPIKKYIFHLVRLFLYLPGILIYPLSFLQLGWFKIRMVSDKQLIGRFNFCCFYPRYPIFRFLTKLEP
jgi:predicted nucleotidyltransferase